MSPLSSLPAISPYSSGVGSGSASANSISDPASSPKSREWPDSQSGSRSSSATPATESRNADKEVGGLDEAQLKELAELKARDREVRAHEAAHQATGGPHAGAMSLTYQRGPDGAQYAVGGEVSISMSSVDGNPQATIEKMRTVRAAAMAPAQPSGQDQAVAAQAMQVMLQAQSELAAEQDATDPAANVSASDNQDSSARFQESDSEQPSRTGQQARNTYQNIADFGSEPAPGMDGFLSISI
ncbi:MAG: putative metalloprotease CJM1_0395 family protein [Marinobacter sp.]|uniref:putative metalloprotease CJM1_0395 family protein n=1 Tax=Marinobacter sp. TaxID=50741 RepID=UPI003F97FAD9